MTLEIDVTKFFIFLRVNHFIFSISCIIVCTFLFDPILGHVVTKAQHTSSLTCNILLLKVKLSALVRADRCYQTKHNTCCFVIVLTGRREAVSVRMGEINETVAKWREQDSKWGIRKRPPLWAQNCTLTQVQRSKSQHSALNVILYPFSVVKLWIYQSKPGTKLGSNIRS